jgi:hypothetical protein
MSVFKCNERNGDGMEKERYSARAIPRRPLFHEARLGFVRVANPGGGEGLV